MKKLNSLSKDIVNAVKLFAEFGSRNEYVRKGVTVIVNDVREPEKEGIYLARLARQIARKQGVEYAYEWALKAFSDGIYNRLQTRNKEHLTPRQEMLDNMRLFGAKTLVYLKQKTGTSIKQAYNL